MKTPVRVLIKVLCFLVLFEAFLHIGGDVFLCMQQLADRLSGPAHASASAKKCVVLVLGDSMTANGGMDSYSKIAERILNQNGSGIQYELINRGAPGRASINLDSSLNGLMDRFDPDIVVTMMGMTDADYLENRKGSFMVTLLEHIKILRLIKRLTDPLRPDLYNDADQQAKVLPMSADEDKKGGQDLGKLEMQDPARARLKLDWLMHPRPLTISAYQDFVETVRGRNKKLIIIQYPLISIKPLEDMVPFKDGVIFVSNEANFRAAIAASSKEEYFSDLITPIFGHCTTKGNRLIAQALAPAIASAFRQR